MKKIFRILFLLLLVSCIVWNFYATHWYVQGAFWFVSFEKLVIEFFLHGKAWIAFSFLTFLCNSVITFFLVKRIIDDFPRVKKRIQDRKSASKQKKIARLQEKLKDLSEKDGE